MEPKQELVEVMEPMEGDVEAMKEIIEIIRESFQEMAEPEDRLQME